MGGLKPPTGSATDRRLVLVGSPCWSGPGGIGQALAARDALLLLLLAIEGPVARARIAALLWPDSPPRQAGISLRQRLFRLKRAMGVSVVTGDATIQLAADVSHDLAAPDAGLREDPRHAMGQLLAGVEPLDTEAELAAWLQAARDRWRQQLLRTLAMLAEQHAAAGRIAAALPYAERLVAEDPAGEHAHRRLMRLHYLRGDRAAALAAYRRCTDTLRREIGVDPGPETRALGHQIVEGEPVSQAPAASPLPLCLLRPPRLIGRDGARHQIERSLAAGRPVLLLGEAGMGKSRLLADFAGTRSGWVTADARPGDATVAYSLLSTLLGELVRCCGAPGTAWAAAELARLTPALGPAASGAFSALRLRQALRQALADWCGAGLAGIVIDDLHFADASSIELLLPLAAGSAPGWLFAQRPGVPRPAAFDDWAQVTLGPLSPGEVAELVETLALPGWQTAGLGAALARRTGGNPLFLLRALGAWLTAGESPSGDELPPLPDDLAALVEQRLHQVSALARGVARAAAVAGESFDIALAAGLLGRRPLELADAVQELRAAHLMDGGAFAHDLVRDAALRSTPPEVAALLQREVARALAARGVAPARVAGHWEAAACWQEAAAAYAAADTQAASASALGERRAALEGQARCLRAGGHAGDLRAAFDADARLVRLLIQMLETHTAETVAGALRTQAVDDGQRAVALELLAHVRLERQDAADALLLANEARSVAGQAGERRVALLAAQRAAVALSRLGRADDAVAALETEADTLEPLDADEQLHWLNDFAVALDGADRRRQAVSTLERVAALAASLRRTAVEVEAWSQLGVTLMYAGRLGDSTAAYRRSITLAQQAGLDDTSLLVDRMGMYGNLRDLGHYEAYLAHAEGLPDALRQAGLAFWAANAENDLATTYAMLGRTDLALRTLAPLGPEQPALMRGLRLLVRASLARYYGVGKPPPGGLAAWTSEAVGLIADHGGRGYLRLRLLLETAADLAPDEGISCVQAVLDEADHREMPMLAAAAGLQRVRLLLAADRGADAAAAARLALARDAADGPQAGVFRPAFGWLMHRALRDVDPPRATAVLHDTAAWIARTAAEHVPPLFRESFLQRQPSNAAVLAAARRARA